MSRLETITLRPQQFKPKQRQMTVQDLEAAIQVQHRVQDGQLILERSLRSWKLQEQVRVPVEKALAVGDPQLLSYIIAGLAPTRSKLIPFVLANRSLVAMARHFRYECSGSPQSLYTYAEAVDLYSRFLDASPDRIIDDVKSGTNLADPTKVQNHTGLLEEYMKYLQSGGASPGTVSNQIKETRTFYRCNGVKIELGHKIKRRVKYKDQVPTPEELAKILDLADLREKVILTLPALAGFREETLAKLEYRHAREDLEAGKIPLHIHVEEGILKGQYGEHDTFLAAEGVYYLRLYLEQRRRGSPDGRIPPEVLNDNSPLIRADRFRTPKPIGGKQVGKIVRSLYARAGLLKKIGGRMYNYREHSLRKYFKTQLVSKGVPESHVDYWMAHVTDTYNQVASLGVEKQRQEYAAAGLSIRPRTQISKLDTIKEIIRAMGEDPERILTKETLTRQAICTTPQEDYADQHTQILQDYLRQLLQTAQKTSTQTP